jgi:hypothetical protein
VQRNATYNKIRQILDTASQSNLGINGLAQSIHDNPNSFIYYRRVDGQVREYPCQLSTIRDKIRFCIELGFLDNEQNCALTSAGLEAQDADRFGLVLQQALLEYLENNDLPWSRIKSAIEELEYPGPRQIYAELSPSLSEDLFRTCLFLLSQCGADMDQNILNSHVMKIYQT